MKMFTGMSIHKYRELIDAKIQNEILNLNEALLKETHEEDIATAIFSSNWMRLAEVDLKKISKPKTTRVHVLGEGYQDLFTYEIPFKGNAFTFLLYPETTLRNNYPIEYEIEGDKIEISIQPAKILKGNDNEDFKKQAQTIIKLHIAHIELTLEKFDKYADKFNTMLLEDITKRIKQQKKELRKN